MASKSLFICGSGREPFSYMNYSNSVCVSPSYFGEYILTFLLSMTSSSFPIQHIVWEYKDSTSFWISKSNFTFLLSFGPSWLRCHTKEAMDEEFWICIIVFFQNSCTSQIKAIPSHQQFLPRLFTESVPLWNIIQTDPLQLSSWPPILTILTPWKKCICGGQYDNNYEVDPPLSEIQSRIVCYV